MNKLIQMNPFTSEISRSRQSARLIFHLFSLPSLHWRIRNGMECSTPRKQTARANGRIVSPSQVQIGSFFRLNRTMRAKRGVISTVSVGCVSPRGASILIILIFHRYHRPRQSTSDHLPSVHARSRQHVEFHHDILKRLKPLTSSSALLEMKSSRNFRTRARKGGFVSLSLLIFEEIILLSFFVRGF